MLPTTAFLAGVFACAALLHGMVGIGFTLIPTAVLSLSMDMKHAVALTALPMLLINSLSVVSGGPVKPILRRYGLLAICSVAGSWIGVKLLLLLPAHWLQLGLAAMILLYVLLALRPHPPQLPNHPGIGALFGLLAGVVGGATNAMSAVLMVYLLSTSRNKNEIAQAGNLCFALAKLTQIILLWPLMHSMAIPAALWIWPGLVAVAILFVGVRLRQRIPFGLFRGLSLGILVMLALILLSKSVGI